MNKAKLIGYMTKHTKLRKATCKTAIGRFIKSIGASFKSGESVVIK